MKELRTKFEKSEVKLVISIRIIQLIFKLPNILRRNFCDGRVIFGVGLVITFGEEKKDIFLWLLCTCALGDGVGHMLSLVFLEAQIAELKVAALAHHVRAADRSLDPGGTAGAFPCVGCHPPLIGLSLHKLRRKIGACLCLLTAHVGMSSRHAVDAKDSVAANTCGTATGRIHETAQLTDWTEAHISHQVDRAGQHVVFVATEDLRL